MKGDKIMKKTVGRNKSRFVTIVSLAIALSLTFTAFAGCNAAGTNMAPSIDFSEDGVSNEDKFNNEEYEEIIENKFISVKENPLSTFSADVDTAAYSNLGNGLLKGFLGSHRRGAVACAG
jgi:Ca-activated chloride channel family protein